MKQHFFLFLLSLSISCQNTPNATSKIKEDVFFLANDSLEGRQTGTAGEVKAAEYIAKRMKELGLSAEGTNGYFQEFSFLPKTDPHKEVEFTTN